MNRILLAAAAAAATLTASAALADDPMGTTYGNTVVTTDKATGASAMLMFNADKTYTGQATGKDGKPVNYGGTWSTKDGDKTICMTMTAPAGQAAPPPSCSPLESHKVGETWTVTNDQKQTFDVTIKPGR